jgi:FixJ family two-component response regulator
LRRQSLYRNQRVSDSNKAVNSTSLRAQPVSPSVFLLERDRQTSIRTGEILGALGLQARVIEKLSDIFKAARVEMPGAVMIDLSTAGASDDPHSRMGSDHVLRVLRQMYPQLCIVVLSESADPRIDALSREFEAPMLIKPFETAALRSVLEGCRVLSSSNDSANDSSEERPTFSARARDPSGRAPFDQNDLLTVKP